MNEKNRSRPRGERPARPQGGPPSRSGPGGGAPRAGRSRGPSAEDLLDIADELEEHGRELLRQARQLQRMAQGMEGGGERGRPARAPRASGGADREKRPRRRDSEEERPSRSEPRASGAPDWAPQGKRRRS